MQSICKDISGAQLLPGCVCPISQQSKKRSAGWDNVTKLNGLQQSNIKDIPNACQEMANSFTTGHGQSSESVNTMRKSPLPDHLLFSPSKLINVIVN